SEHGSSCFDRAGRSTGAVSDTAFELLTGGLFALVFLRVLVAYVRSRDPLQRDLTLVFSAMTMIFLLTVMRLVFGEVPPAARYASVALLLAQPYLTLRLVGQLHPVPRWLPPAAAVAYVVTTVWLLSLPAGNAAAVLT